jgi:hypothetical protein
MTEGTKDYTAPRYAYGSPLALKLFMLEGVNRVFYGKDFISVSKEEGVDWNILKPMVYGVIMDYFTSD